MKIKQLCFALVFLTLGMSCFGVDNKFLNRIANIRTQPAFNIWVNGDKVITKNQNQVWIYSVFNPWQPQIDASYYSVAPIEDIDLMGDRYLFISTREPTNTLLPIDSLNVYGKIFFPTLLLGDKIRREGSVLHISDLQRGIEIIDIGSGGSRETKSVFSEKWGIRDFVAEYPYLYALNDFGVVTVDIGDLRNPQSIGLNYQLNNATIIRKNGEMLWIATGKDLMIISVRDLDRPNLINQYRFAYDILDLEIKDDRIFVALGFGGVRILDISNPLRIQDLNWINLQSSALDVALDKDFIYIASGTQGWFVYQYR